MDKRTRIMQIVKTEFNGDIEAFNESVGATEYVCDECQFGIVAGEFYVWISPGGLCYCQLCNYDLPNNIRGQNTKMDTIPSTLTEVHRRLGCNAEVCPICDGDV